MKSALLSRLIIIFSFLPLSFSFGQQTITGTLSSEDGESLIGANVSIVNTIIGTVSDENGYFELRTNLDAPFDLSISYTGYETLNLTVDDNFDLGNIQMKSAPKQLNEVIVSVSKVEEKLMEAPVSVEKLDIRELRSSPAADPYGALSHIKGVQANTGSFSFTSVNTRGFADMQNWRFVQLIDGMDASSPGLNYPLGGNSGPSEIEILSMELIPGANSALYGANAFNGLLTIQTKSPFYYQGLSAYAKTGITTQKGESTNPFLDMGFRYAHSFNDKLAFRLSLGTIQATDWTANDYSYHIDTRDIANQDVLLALPSNHPNFDAVNVYGDHVQAQVDLDGSGELSPINRTGIKEKDLVDYNVQTYKGNAQIAYRFNDQLEASYDYRMVISDGILRHTAVYPLVNFRQQFHRLDLKGKDFQFKTYYSLENADEIYSTQSAGAYIETRRKSNEDWADDYGMAFQGLVNGIAASDHDAARNYADRDLVEIGSELFNQFRNETLNNPDFPNGGAQFFEQSQLFHMDGNYNISPLERYLDLQVGGSFRRYEFFSGGSLFNDGPLGFNQSIPMWEYGMYVQGAKSLWKERLKLRASLRLDKNQNFKATLTPRVSAVVALDKKKQHYFRSSYQSGFRNPGSQESYFAVDVGPVIILGGVENNLDNYSAITTDGSLIDGKTLHANLYTLPSYLEFLDSGDPSVLTLANLPYMEQEKNSTIEVGYKGIIKEKLFIDINYYHTRYSNFAVRINTASPDVGRIYAIYTNITDDIVTSQGIGMKLDYSLPLNLKLGLGYEFSHFDADDAVANTPGFLPSFNTPKHRLNASISQTDIAGTGLGFNLKYRWSDDYIWQSPFGQGNIDSFSVVDLAFTYSVPSLKSNIKLGAANLLNQGYNTVYGGPKVGGMYYISWTFDDMLN